MACRNFLKAEKAAKSVGIPRENYTVIHLDLASLDNIRQFVDASRLLSTDPTFTFTLRAAQLSSTEGFVEEDSAMAGFEQQVKDRAYELKVLLKKGVKIVGEYSKKGWNKVKNIKR
ncbi:hypothetical protein SAY87_013420 [Trapa incisa]|uniref:Uncharacterized protein n=1 Tax=Trapa incisa TaxID=236973 RepID=A0AAN7QD07_9MYRT|nr:hypothetical protein SAY87_013420 [Trapa incisa]